MAASLPSECCLIDFFEYTHVDPAPQAKDVPRAERRLVAFVLSHGSKLATCEELGPSERIDALVQTWRAHYGVARLFAGWRLRLPGAELRKLLWEPLAKHLGRAKTILVSPDGPLHGLPWAQLCQAASPTHISYRKALASPSFPFRDCCPTWCGNREDLKAFSMLLVGGIDFDKSKLMILQATWPSQRMVGRSTVFLRD